jgi:hypothetical protein
LNGIGNKSFFSDHPAPVISGRLENLRLTK